MEIKSTTKRVKKIGEICNDLQECVVNNSICFNNTCQCKDGFVASSGKHECLKRKLIIFIFNLKKQIFVKNKMILLQQSLTVYPTLFH